MGGEVSGVLIIRGRGGWGEGSGVLIIRGRAGWGVRDQKHGEK